MLPKTPRIWQVTGAPLSNLRLAVAGLSMALPTSPHPVPDPLFPLRSSIAHHHEIERYIAAHEAGWKNPQHAAQWPDTLSGYVYPVLGELAVQAIEHSTGGEGDRTDLDAGCCLSPGRRDI